MQNEFEPKNIRRAKEMLSRQLEIAEKNLKGKHTSSQEIQKGSFRSFIHRLKDFLKHFL